MARLGRLLVRLDRRRLPAHITPVARQLVTTMAGALPAPTSTALRGLLNPRLTDATSTALGERGRVFDPLPHHTLRAIGQDADPAGLPVPLLLSGVTDGRFFARLGIQTYGFLPLNLPPGFDFTRLIHAADERLPVAALDFGTRAIAETLRRFGEATTP
jgi:hypothetical protein